MEIFAKIVAIGGILCAMGFGFFMLKYVHIDLKDPRTTGRGFLTYLCGVLWAVEVFALCALVYFIVSFPK